MLTLTSVSVIIAALVKSLMPVKPPPPPPALLMTSPPGVTPSLSLKVLVGTSKNTRSLSPINVVPLTLFFCVVLNFCTVIGLIL